MKDPGTEKEILVFHSPLFDCLFLASILVSLKRPKQTKTTKQQNKQQTGFTQNPSLRNRKLNHASMMPSNSVLFVTKSVATPLKLDTTSPLVTAQPPLPTLTPPPPQ